MSHGRVTIATALIPFVLSGTSVLCLAQDPFSYPDSGCAATPEVAEEPILAATCDSSGVKFTEYDDVQTSKDIQLIYGGLFVSTGFPYLDNGRINQYLAGLNVDALKNEYHVDWSDLELNYNYFHGKDSTQYYGTFGPGAPSCSLFSHLSGIAFSERNHVDVYLKHYLSGVPNDTYPLRCVGAGTLGCADVKEDGNSSSCDEFSNNAIQSGAGHFGVRNQSNPFDIDYVADPTWHAQGKGTNVRTNHEYQHMLLASRRALTSNDEASGFPNETYSMAAEYLVGAGPRDSLRSVYNATYDIGLTTKDAGKAYSHWYLWSAYLLQQFVGDSTRIEDDLYYKWVRNRNPLNNQLDPYMSGLARALGGAEYDVLGLGASGAERLGNVFHNYSLAKWIDDPSASLEQGRLGFGRGVDPYWHGALFDNSFNPRDRRTALEVPPKYVVGLAQAAVPCSLQNRRWCYTDRGEGKYGVRDSTFCDSSGVTVWSADYLQFEADPGFEDAQQDTLHISIKWDPTMYPDPPGFLSLGRLKLRITALTYGIRSDSLYRYGTQLLDMNEAAIDTLQGRCDIVVPGFGNAVKSVLLVLDMAQQTPSGEALQHKLYYDYSFRVTPTRVSPEGITLEAYRPSGTTADLLTWSDPSGWGAGGYYIQRATGSPGEWAVVDSMNPLESSRSLDPIAGSTIKYYRVVPKFNQSVGVSNLATVGGLIDQSQTISGSVYASGDVTVDTGDVLTLSAGAKISLRPGHDSQRSGVDTTRTEVIVNGSLYAAGSAADSIVWESAGTNPAPGDWQGLKLNSPTSSSRLEYNVIRHGYHGLRVASAQSNYTFKVHRSRVQHSLLYGLYVEGGYPEVMYSVFEQNHGAEIVVTSSGLPRIHKCHLRYSPDLGAGNVDDGAVFMSGGAGTLRYSKIDGVGIGIYCLGTGSDPWLRGVASSPDSSKYGKNDVVNFLNYGVRTVDGASPNLGYGSGGETQYFSGHNNIHSTDADALFVSHSGSSDLSARWNYWGANPPVSSRFSGPIDGPFAPSNAYLASAEGSTGPGFNPAGSMTSSTDLLVESAWQKEESGNFTEAKAAYEEIIEGNPEDPTAVEALTRLVGMQIRNGSAATIVEYTQALVRNSLSAALQRTARRLEPRLLFASGHPDSAIACYEELLLDSGTDQGGMLLELALLKGLGQRDQAGARSVIARMKQCCSEPGLLKHTRAMLEEVVGREVWSESDAKEMSAQMAGASYKLSLAQSSPNPMNPFTRIRFSIPRAGHATLRIHDVHGRTVRIVMDKGLAVGEHMVEWDGRNSSGNTVASGMYYYRLTFEGSSLVRKLIVLK